MIRHLVHWVLLPFSQKHYTAWLADWRRHFVALLYPLFDLGLIALVAAGICAAVQEISFSASAAVLGCVCFSLWWSWRMIDISDYTFPDDCLNSLEAFEEFLSSRFASFDDCTANVGRRAFAKRLFELGKIDLLASLAHKYSAVMRAVRQAVVTGPEFPHMERLLQVLDAALPAAGVGGPPPVPALTGLSEGRKFGNGTAGATKAPKSKPEISGDHQT